VPLRSLLTADRRVNLVLEEGDIVYVPKSTMAEVGCCDNLGTISASD
jgi:polysaccharide biosynthesis/export protein